MLNERSRLDTPYIGIGTRTEGTEEDYAHRGNWLRQIDYVIGAGYGNESGPPNRFCIYNALVGWYKTRHLTLEEVSAVLKFCREHPLTPELLEKALKHEISWREAIHAAGHTFKYTLEPGTAAGG